jgi:hypothetical protein
VPLVEPTQELALLATLPHEQKQAVLVPILVDDARRDPAPAQQTKLEVLTLPVRVDVEQTGRLPSAPRPRRRLDDLHPSPDRGEPPLENLGTHGLSFLAAGHWV